MTHRQTLLVAAVFGLAALASGCGDDGATQGVRDLCATGSGTTLGCDHEVIATSEDACWRLVECGAIPLEQPKDDEGVFDWADCVSYLDGLDDYRFDYSLSCVAASTCDELKVDGSPNTPRSLPLCLRHGDQ